MNATAPADGAHARLDADRSDRDAIAAHLSRCSDDFVPPLAERVTIADYAERLATLAARDEAWSGGALVGLVATYCNRPGEDAFVSSVSVEARHRGGGLAGRLLARSIERAARAGAPRIALEVDRGNAAALALYRRHGFEPCGPSGDGSTLRLARRITPGDLR